METFVSVAANFGSMATGIVAVWAWVSFKRKSSDRRGRLEGYLKKVKTEAQANPMESGEGMRSVIHLMAHLYMTESEVYESAFSSKKIKSWPRIGKDGVADHVMLQYNPVRRSKDNP